MTVSRFPAICALALLLGIGAAGCSSGGTSVADLSPPVEEAAEEEAARLAAEEAARKAAEEEAARLAAEEAARKAAEEEAAPPPVTQPVPPTGKPAPSPRPAGPAFTAADVAEIDELTRRMTDIEMREMSLRAIDHSSRDRITLRGKYECNISGGTHCYHPWESRTNPHHGIALSDFLQEDVEGTGRVRRATPVAGEGEILSRGAVTIAYQPVIYYTGIEDPSSYAHLHGWTEFLRFGAWLRDDFGYADVNWSTSNPRISAIGGSSSSYLLHGSADYWHAVPPDASATWKGHMLGHVNLSDILGPGITKPRLGLLIHGDATLSYDLGSNMIDTRFDNIVETANPSRSLPDIVLDRTELSANNGQFKYNRDNWKYYLTGRFYGTSSDPTKEVGGRFRHDRVSGVFGAVKQ